MSNKPNQYLRYWDLSSARTAFYAYAPYVNSTSDPVKLEENPGGNSKLMTFPKGTIKMGTDASQNEFMYAVNKVDKSNYKNDVKLQFHRLNSRVHIKFWENIPGYTAKIVKLNTNQTGTTSYDKDVYAKPAIAPTTASTSYSEGKYLMNAGAKITFSNDERETAAVSSSVEYTDPQYSSDFFTFDMPADNIGEDRATATSSNTTYYMVPKGEFGTTTLDPAIAKTGFIFHVSYELTNNQTNEKIIVTDARVYVPAANCEWARNKSYTYIFKITKSSNGTTGKTDPNPDDMNVPTEQSLYPIVFDGCTVVDYETEIENDYTISDPSAPVYTLSLDRNTIPAGEAITVTVTGSPVSYAIEIWDADSNAWMDSKPGATFPSITTAANQITTTAGSTTTGKYRYICKDAKGNVVATATFTVE